LKAKFFNIFSSKKTFKEKEFFHGEWKAVEFDNEPIENRKFIFVRIILSTNEIQIDIEMEAFGGTVSANSSGNWNLKNDILFSTFENNHTKSVIVIEDDNVISFTPDPFFNSDEVLKSKYIRLK
jgi:hypothetical protein